MTVTCKIETEDQVVMARAALRAERLGGKVAGVGQQAITLSFNDKATLDKFRRARYMPPAAEIGAVIYGWRKNRLTHPPGQMDKARRFSTYEYMDCCEPIRPPSRSWPFSMMLHCRTANHIAELVDSTPRDIRRAHRRRNAAA